MDPTHIFDLTTVQASVAVLIIGMVWVYRKLDRTINTLHGRISDLKDQFHKHEVECASRSGTREAQLEALRVQLDRYTDARFEQLEKSHGQLRGPRST